jgi:hypothetical protein
MAYIDILRQHLIRELIFLQNVVVDRCAREGGAEEEAEETGVQSHH